MQCNTEDDVCTLDILSYFTALFSKWQSYILLIETPSSTLYLVQECPLQVIVTPSKAPLPLYRAVDHRSELLLRYLLSKAEFYLLSQSFIFKRDTDEMYLLLQKEKELLNCPGKIYKHGSTL